MAYTITQPSYTLYPSDNLSWSTASSTDSAQLAFVYRFAVQVGATAGALATVSTNRVPVTPGATTASFAPNAILRNYVTTPLVFDGATGASGSNEGLKTGRVVYGQEFNSNGTIIGSTGATGTPFLFWNSIFSYAEFPTYNQTEWAVGPTSTGVNFLTEGPDTRCLIPQDLLYANVLEGNYGETLGPQQIFPVWGTGSIAVDPAQVFPQVHTSGLTPPAAYNVFVFDDGYIVSGNRTICSASGVGTTGYSNMRYQPFFCPTGSVINILLQSEDEWGIQHPELYLWGATTADTDDPAVFEQIQFFDNAESSGGYHDYFITNFTTTKPYFAFGLRFLAIATSDRCSQIGYFAQPESTWTVQTPDQVLWALTQNNITTRFPAIRGKQNWFNVGSAVRGVTPFSVSVQNAGGDHLTEIITFDGDCDTCSGCEKASLTWLNAYGGYDTFEFLCVNSRGIEAKRQIGQQTLGKTYAVGDRGLYNTANVGTLTQRVNTNYVLPETVTWLESLFMSPDVYLVSPTGTLNPVVVDSTSYSRFATPNKLMVVEFEFTEANLRSSQIR